jgi:Holliday junction resolvase RusA-like endonuclease
MKKKEPQIKQMVHIKLGKVCIGKKIVKCRNTPHSPNYLNTKHWAVRVAWKDAWKEEVWARWQEQKKKFEGVVLPFPCANLQVWVFYSGISQDTDNQFAAMKPIIDALTENKIIIDDAYQYLRIKPIKFVPSTKANEHIELNLELKK